MENVLQDLKSNLDDVIVLITEEKRKSSEVRRCSIVFYLIESILEYHTVSFSYNINGIFFKKKLFNII
jgi:hypothetical protein